jgi:hypothetical protein
MITDQQLRSSISGKDKTTDASTFTDKKPNGWVTQPGRRSRSRGQLEGGSGSGQENVSE